MGFDMPSICTLSEAIAREAHRPARVADAFQTTNFSLIVVCVVFVLFALAGYGIAEPGLLN
jgi:hypothetical protein